MKIFDYFVHFLDVFSKILFPFNVSPFILYPFFVLISFMIILCFFRNKKLAYLKLLMFIYLLVISIKLLLSGSSHSSKSIIASELSEYKSYASRICLSCIGIE
ncbi:hypothetical protein JW890_02265 [candidate division WOR-3 bacterium]|nr:hypothetical protein [candidate division WOR-3 bacterium]